MANRIFSLILLLLIGFAPAAGAALIDRGGGLIYDNDRNITWVQDANLAKTLGRSKDGLMTAAEAMKWASDLVYQGYADWRLPDARNQDKGLPMYGGKARGSEMGHLYYDELGNSSTRKIDIRTGLKNSGLFVNLQPSKYWSGTEYEISSDENFWWYFDFGSGIQWDGVANAGLYAWAVRDGDSCPLDGAVPGPPVFTLPAAPPVVTVPGTELSAAQVEQTVIFTYHGSWWRSFEDRWYRSVSYNGPWQYVRPEQAPAALTGPSLPKQDADRGPAAVDIYRH